MGGAQCQPMAAGEGKRHANERGWRGNPGRGRGLQRRPRAFWKSLEPDARTLLQRPSGSWRLGSGSVSLPPYFFPCQRETHARERARARTHKKTKIRAGDFPPLLCYFCTTMTGKAKRGESQAALRPTARARAAPAPGVQTLPPCGPRGKF